MAKSGAYKCHAIVSIITMVAAVALIIAGIASSAVTFPSDLNAGTAAQRQTVQDLKHTVMIQSALPGAVTFLTCIFGVIGGFRQINGLMMTHMIFAIIMSVWHFVALLIPLIAAAAFSLACTAIKQSCQDPQNSCSASDLKQVEDYCTKTTSTLWATVVLSAACLILSIALASIPCGPLCCSKKDESETGAPFAQAGGVPVAKAV